MSLWPPIPTMVLSTRSTRLFPLQTQADAAMRAGCTGVDLDPTMFLARSGRTGLRRARTAAGIEQVESIWFPATGQTGAIGPRVDAQFDQWLGDVRRIAPRNVVVDRDVALRPAGQRDRRPVLNRLREGLPTGVGIIVMLRPQSLEGTRQHLGSLVTLRRAAEEWDFQLGLDLLGQIDSRWEAEAAIQRLQSRLTLVRLPSIAGDRLFIPRARVVGRTLAYLLDQGYPGTLSLRARLRPLDLVRPGMLAVRATEEVTTVTARYQRLYGAAPSLPSVIMPLETRAHDRG